MSVQKKFLHYTVCMYIHLVNQTYMKKIATLLNCKGILARFNSEHRNSTAI